MRSEPAETKILELGSTEFPLERKFPTIRKVKLENIIS